MNYKAISVLLSVSVMLPLSGCIKTSKAPVISGSYEGAIPVSGSRTDLGIGYFESSLPVYLEIGEDNTFTMELDLRALKDELYDVADDIESGGVYVVKDVTVEGNDYYEGTVTYVDDHFEFSADEIEFDATIDEDGILTAEDFFGEDIVQFE